MAFSESLLMSVIGMAIVFAVILILMGFISIMSIFTSKPQKAVNTEQNTVLNSNSAKTNTGVKLVGVSERNAAMIMAIVANKLDLPLNRLKFISIKEIK